MSKPGAGARLTVPPTLAKDAAVKTGAGTAKIDRAEESRTWDEVAAIKAEFRREDAALARAGRAQEALAKNVSALDIDPNGERPRLLSINGVRFRG